MAKIQINNPRQIINGGAKKYYFKVKGLGGPKGDKGDKGDTGSQGPQGPQGNAATVSVGSTTTLPVGYDATVTNSGSIYNAVLNFGIPQGPQGPQGAKGDKGDTGAKGETGPRGPQGEKGTNATVYVGTTTTTNPGTQARVYNSGTDSNAVLNFEIPRGDVGPSVPLVQETGYSTTKAMSQNATTEALNGKQNTLTAGSNIQISGSTISATDTKYSAGNGITLTGTQFSANTSVLATKNELSSYYTKTQIDSQMAAKQDDLVAGSNIQIAPDGKTISATDTTYTAGTGLTLTGTEFSADTTVLATQAGLTTALAPKLEAEVVAELPATGAEGKLYLTPKAHTTSTATGNPIEATITAQAGQLESFQLDGDTFQQSYSGSNLLNATPATSGGLNGLSATIENDGSIHLTGVSTANYSNFLTIQDKTLAAGNYVLSVDKNLPFKVNLRVVYSDLTNETFYRSRELDLPISFAKQVTSFYVYVGSTISGTTYNETFKVWLSSGSTATSYEPYVGGQPSPNPSYPQDINVVTGTQTISINGTNYPLDLGDIQLCGLGDDGNGNPLYKDRIYRDGDEWKIHKENTKATFNGTEAGWNATVQTAPYFINLAERAFGNYCDGISTHFKNRKAYPSNAGEFAIRTEGNTISFNKGGLASLDEWLSWLGSNNVTAYYPLALGLVTDTTITDTTLIAQLEAIRTALLQNGANTITNTATGSNLAGDMGIGYYGFNPRNRYDKFIWLDLNNAYEQLNNPDTSSTLSTLSTRSLGATTEQPTVTRSLETETITLKKCETEPIEDKTELPTILDEEAEKTETTDPEESDGTDER